MKRPAPRNLIVAELATTEENQIIAVEVSYCEGGANYFSGGNTSRGYYLSANLVKITENCRSYIPTNGVRGNILEVERFNRKELERQAASARVNPMFDKLVQHVITRTGCKLKDTTPTLPSSLPNPNLAPEEEVSSPS